MCARECHPPPAPASLRPPRPLCARARAISSAACPACWAQVLLKGVEFLYRHWDLLPEDKANDLRELFLVGPYWRLLLHWSPAVRKFFAHLLVFRLQRPCGWSMPPTALLLRAEALPEGLAASFARRAAHLRMLAEARRASTATAAVNGSSGHWAIPPGDSTEALQRLHSAGATGAGEPQHARARPPRGGEAAPMAAAVVEASEVPPHLGVYAPAALALYEELAEAQRALEEAMARSVSGAGGAVGAVGAPSAVEGPLTLPALRWDTSVLDVEEDRVIWVRESDLGKAVREAAEEIRVS